jgi:NAD(P)-dependent dehydrogenase (short-subunit alcohol dehydrogenase family)
VAPVPCTRGRRVAATRAAPAAKHRSRARARAAVGAVWRERARIVIVDVARAGRGSSSGRGGRGPVVPWASRLWRASPSLGAAVASFGGADILIDNAGIETLVERDVRAIPTVMAVNLDSMFLLCKAFVPTMTERPWAASSASQPARTTTARRGALSHVESKGRHRRVRPFAGVCARRVSPGSAWADDDVAERKPLRGRLRHQVWTTFEGGSRSVASLSLARRLAGPLISADVLTGIIGWRRRCA